MIKSATRERKLLKRLGRAARRAGCSSGQIERFLRYGYVLTPKQLQLHAAARRADQADQPVEIGFGGARGGGKSHGEFAQAALDDCQRVPGLRVLYVRQIQRNARQQIDQLRRDVLFGITHRYVRNEGEIRFPNNSGIVVGGFRYSSDIDKYLGLQYDEIVVEEATALMSEYYQALLDSLRTNIPGWRPRIYNSTNPGGVGHQWYYEAFVKGRDSDTLFIPSTVDDNPHVDDGYRGRLEKNTGWRLQAYRYGDWSVMAGQFFTTWREDRHVVAPMGRRDFSGWVVWGALDYGRVHWNVFYLLARSPSGDVYYIDECARREALVSQNAADIVAMLWRYQLRPHELHHIAAGPDVFARGASELTIADQYAQYGLVLTSADTDRVGGAALMLDYLGDEHVKPRLFVTRRCKLLIETMPLLQHDPKRPDDVLKVDCDSDGRGGDDGYDGARYGLKTQPLAYDVRVDASELGAWRG